MKRWIAVMMITALCVGSCLTGCSMPGSKGSSVEDVELTEVQKITTIDLEKDYPETPRAVVKLFNRILKCYYGETYTDVELKELTGKAWELFDQELQANNTSPEEYTKAVKAEVQEYKNKKRKISQSDVCDSDQVQYLSEKNKNTGKEDSLAYVAASYFVKEGNDFTNTYEKYVLRQDQDGRWKILVFYQIDKDEKPSDD